MKLVKGLVCMLLSLVVLTLGIGYAQLTDEITATGELNYTHASLYISDMTPDTGVTVIGYSETLINLNVTEAEKSIKIKITNPTQDPYYYLNNTSSNENFTMVGAGACDYLYKIFFIKSMIKPFGTFIRMLISKFFNILKLTINYFVCIK